MSLMLCPVCSLMFSVASVVSLLSLTLSVFSYPRRSVTSTCIAMTPNQGETEPLVIGADLKRDLMRRINLDLWGQVGLTDVCCRIV